MDLSAEDPEQKPGNEKPDFGVKEYQEAQYLLQSALKVFLCTARINISQDKLEFCRGRDLWTAMENLGSWEKVKEYFLSLMVCAKDRENYQQLFSREALLQAFAQGKKQMSGDFCVREVGGSAMWVRLEMRLLRNPDNKDLTAFATVKDIHHDKILEIITGRTLLNQFDYITTIDMDAGTMEMIMGKAKEKLQKLYVTNDYEKNIQLYIEQYIPKDEQEYCLKIMSLSSIREGLEGSDHYFFDMTVLENGSPREKQVDFYYLDRMRGLVVYLRTDCTDRHREEAAHKERLQLALTAAQQASVAKSQFLSRMSHEIRTPMNAIIGLDTLALQEKDISPVLEDYLSKISISAHFLLSLINDILDMSRIESGRMLLKREEFSFEKLLDSVNTIFYNQCLGKGLTYECVVKGFTEERYIGDMLKIQQILVNLLGNAVKFTPRGGKVQLLVEQLHREGSNAKLRFSVMDTGKGISEEFLPHIFEPFSQENAGMGSNYGGTGLGLPISKNLVALMDGDIYVHSVKGMGSTFVATVNLGLTSENEEQYQSETIALSALKTLIVDDDDMECQHAEVVLKNAGIDAEWVDSGRAAIEKVQAKHQLYQDYRLILIDWKMPEMDGLETAQALRKIVGPEVTILILTAYDWSEIEQQARLCGVDDFMRKPIFASSVIRAYDDAKLQRRQVVKHKDYDFSGCRALIVEDNAINAEIAKKLLEHKGFAADVAKNGVEAIDRFTRSKVGEYDVILMDICMPFMDGLEAAKTIRAIKKGDSLTVPIVAMSANAFDEDVHKSLANGMNAHLSKPLDADLMYDTLEKLLNKRR